jgi:hypothetical protein
MSTAYIPYNGTAGWSGTDTSKARAIDNVKSGREKNHQILALKHLKLAGTSGVTWKELADSQGWHHGTASGVLSVLHQSGAIVRAIKARNRCKIYIHQDYKDLVIHEVYKKRKKLCPHCGNDINA